MKIAATLSSTGTPAFYLHAADATHGDLGMVEKRCYYWNFQKWKFARGKRPYTFSKKKWQYSHWNDLQPRVFSCKTIRLYALHANR